VDVPSRDLTLRVERRVPQPERDEDAALQLLSDPVPGDLLDDEARDDVAGVAVRRP
jgi:hypothetical protein